MASRFSRPRHSDLPDERDWEKVEPQAVEEREEVDEAAPQVDLRHKSHTHQRYINHKRRRLNGH